LLHRQIWRREKPWERKFYDFDNKEEVIYKNGVKIKKRETEQE